MEYDEKVKIMKQWGGGIFDETPIRGDRPFMSACWNQIAPGGLALEAVARGAMLALTVTGYLTMNIHEEGKTVNVQVQVTRPLKPGE